MRGIAAAIKLEEVVYGHMTEINGKFKMRATEVTCAPGGFLGIHHHVGPGIRYVISGEVAFPRAGVPRSIRPETKRDDQRVGSERILPKDWAPDGHSAQAVAASGIEIKLEKFAPVAKEIAFSHDVLCWPMCTRFIMAFAPLVSRLSAPLIALFVTFAAIHAPVHAAEDLRKVTVVSFGLFGDQGVFRREATGAAQIVGSRFGHGSVVVRFNTKKGGGATVEALAATLNAEAKKMNGESDILFLVLTSHGSPDGLAVVAGRLTEILKPSTLAEMLDQTGVRHKVVIISACYSGVFIPHLANADTLVITAADADHASFGCEDKAKWTYFGDAFFNNALRQTKTLKDAFLLARTLVSKRELRQGFDPSHPQMAGGANVESLLVARP
jgi:hypothetical protein